ncbi:chemotaxis protein CheD [Brachyspira pulli]
MNHFMLPEMREWENPAEDYNNTRYGVFAMEVLINEIIKLGGKKENLTAKIFGGGHVLSGMTSNILQVPDKNIQFAKKFLADEKIPIVSEDIGGSWPRKVFFFNTENRVLMKKLEGKTKEFSAEQEIKYSKNLQHKLEEKSDITLF